MAATMQLRLRGDGVMEAALGALVRGFDDLEPLAEIFGTYLESSTIERFDAEVGPDGQPWDKSIRAKEEGGQTLTDSSQLRSSIHAEAANGSVRWGSNKIYARMMNDGGTIRAKGSGKLTFRLPGGLGFRSVDEVTIPARPFLGINAEDEAELIALTEDYAASLGGLS
ncbi:phage virion morphogenesis protein [Porphyrobacter sp. YT40]|uniref:phage virion morphogenesis protein n=1 Tax=Porphyrobacter sp. YT40 TaxID=2547601 RepID=UPI001143145D|nr:phage virion morphogenesis protein [Porphyrobacter sp. YT40]QDH35847.1 phage virion morphogenesis protein [Porphyrobacter sp. YT40]